MSCETHTFHARDLIAGNLVLDLVNTVAGRNAAPRDWLCDYPTLIKWARLTGEFSSADLRSLNLLVEANPLIAEQAFVRLRSFRETLCEVLYGIARGTQPKANGRAAIERAYRLALEAGQLKWHHSKCELTWSVSESGADVILHVMAAKTIRLLNEMDARRLRICAGPDCGWLFLDASRNSRRRWCDMATCGNVAKARRHYSRRIAR